jgi:hypothetical protein
MEHPIYLRHLLVRIKKAPDSLQDGDPLRCNCQRGFDRLLGLDSLRSARAHGDLAVGLNQTLGKTGLNVPEHDIPIIDQRRWNDVSQMYQVKKGLPSQPICLLALNSFAVK